MKTVADLVADDASRQHMEDMANLATPTERKELEAALDASVTWVLPAKYLFMLQTLVKKHILDCVSGLAESLEAGDVERAEGYRLAGSASVEVMGAIDEVAENETARVVDRFRKTIADRAQMAKDIMKAGLQ